MFLKNLIKKYKIFRNLYSFYLGGKVFIKFNPIMFVKQYIWFVKQLSNFNKMKGNENFCNLQWYPCLGDNVASTPLDPTYFFQDTWAAKHIFRLKPSHHYDVGSAAKTIGIISQFTPTTMIDIRPIELELNNLFFIKGSILELPFEDNSIDSLSSLCVVEHIGLGRYGDPIDPFGSEKAIKELKRVLNIGGVILFSVPVDKENTIYFNAHRAFTRDYILTLFSGFSVVEEKYHYGNELLETYFPERGFGTGLYMLKKEIEC